MGFWLNTIGDGLGACELTLEMVGSDVFWSLIHGILDFSVSDVMVVDALAVFIIGDFLWV